jgi:hypothetical protein
LSPELLKGYYWILELDFLQKEYFLEFLQSEIIPSYNMLSIDIVEFHHWMQQKKFSSKRFEAA